MHTPLRITFQNTPSSAAIRKLIEEQVDHLEQFFGRMTACHVVFKLPDGNHRTGGLYEVTVHLKMPGGQTLDIGRTPGAIVVRSDVERKRNADIPLEQRMPAGSYTPEASARIYVDMLRRAEQALRAGNAAAAYDCLKYVAANERYLTSADRERFLQLQSQALPVAAAPAADTRVADTRAVGTPVATLPMGARVTLVREDGPFAVTREGHHLPRNHLGPLDAHAADFVAVAERFVGAPYLWGGKSCLGIDCSGLVQLSLNAAGLPSPRDSDMQQRALGHALDTTEWSRLRRGDLIFWKGHVAIARDAETIVHANAHHMATVIESTADAVARIAAAGSDIVALKRV